jgi:NADPH-dependent 2,4-dienoyl-CoA reductase/sulfur reductase-like enzyme
MTEQTCDIAVVGAGPAGMAAAVTAAGLGLRVTALDENGAPGGQIYRAIEQPRVPADSVLGADYLHGRTLTSAFRGTPGIAFEPRASVWSLTPEAVLHASQGGRSFGLLARAVVLASGARERAIPFPGWTLPGVMTCGAAQTMMKADGLMPTGRVVLAGTGPLLLLLAAQIIRAGGNIAALLDTTEPGALARSRGDVWSFLRSPYFGKGLALLAEVRRRVRFVGGVEALAAEGPGRLARVRYRRGRQEATIDADLLLVHQGVVPNRELAEVAGLTSRWDARQLAFTAAAEVASSRIFQAGDCTAIGGARVAEESGRLAALAAARAIGAIDAATAERLGAEPRARLARAERGRAFLDRWFRPLQAFRLPADDVVVCRCEDVTAGEVRRMVRDAGVLGPSQAKSFLRCGMGPCQGRICGLPVTEIIAEARGVDAGEVGAYRSRVPVKPVTVGELAVLADLPHPRYDD